MESVNFINDLQDLESNDGVREESLLGWSSTCLDETLSYYVEHNSEEVREERKTFN
uniref:Uncharacterized protein n=1 Tax=Palmaria decipiens TaxID=187399 RepID=A0A6C0W1R4_PALDE|nr:hypothetical protein [Palmaria decipiens]QIC19601.1 hypothetical protein [Palmaria decipiens]